MKYKICLAVMGACLACQQGEREDKAAAAMSTVVTYESLVNADADPGNWLTYSGQYHGRRFSRLDRITRDNVHRLQIKWVYQLETLNAVETSPLVVDGVMYLTRSPSDVIALDARTGRPYWTYEHQLPDNVPVCCGRQNRGVAILGDRLYLGALDARLIALDAKTGSIIWNVEVADEQAGYSITSAPLVVQDKVITGIAGGEYGIRGFIDAYDAETGARIWRFNTIPGPGEAGHETWEGDSWQTGGAPTWLTGSYDPELNLLYWGVGNPGPDFSGEHREGDNLYSDCVLALDADTGELDWFFQFTPHDVHDWDACQIPVLIDEVFLGRQRKLLLWANRNSFFYVLDRQTGEFLRATEFAKQTWAERIDDKGRPIRRPNTLPSAEGTFVYPHVSGATNWWSPSYSPETGLFYVTAFDAGHDYFTGEEEYVPGQLFLGGYPDWNEPMEKYERFVRAIDLQTGEIGWEYPLNPKSTSGLLSTSGSIVFGGTFDGYFFALDAKSGETLWHLNIGGNVHAAPISYLVDGRQYVTIAAGGAIFTFGLD